MTTTESDHRWTWLGRWLTGLALVVVIAQFMFWFPEYLTWPYWADHDVFASAAQAWDAGILPYRDFRLNQTPGTLYLFWVLGRVVGWGQPAWFYGLDAALVGALLVALLVWSRVRFGRLAPGLIGALAIEVIFFDLDYAHTAQRDTQAPLLAFLALLILQIGPRSVVGLVATAALTAFALAIRPQVILLVPALVGSAGWLDPERSVRASLGRSLVWLGSVGGFGLLLLLPLYQAGLLGDFAASLRVVAPGGAYSQTGAFFEVARRWTGQASSARWCVVVVLTLVLLARNRSALDQRLGGFWLLALAGASLWLPLSPVPHTYLAMPLTILATGPACVAFVWASDPRSVPRPYRPILAIGLAVLTIPSVRGEFAQPGVSLRLVSGWIRSAGSGAERPHELTPEQTPPGYRPGRFYFIAYYPWADYAATLNYLRRETTPTTRVANLLKGCPAVAGMVGRISALPAEAITWLRMVRAADTPAFAHHLEAETDSVVVWIPHEPDPDGRRPENLGELQAVVERSYRPAARFGQIEVWRRVDPKPLLGTLR